jgi:hypothetical protein
LFFLKDGEKQISSSEQDDEEGGGRLILNEIKFLL